MPTVFCVVLSKKNKKKTKQGTKKNRAWSISLKNSQTITQDRRESRKIVIQVPTETFNWDVKVLVFGNSQE